MRNIFLLLFLFISSNCYASQNVAIININDVFQKSSVGLNLNNEIKQKQETLKSEIIRKQEDLQKQKVTINKQKNVLSKEGYGKKEEELENKFIQLQKEVKEKTDKLEAEYFEKLNKINEKINQIVSQYSVKKNIDLLIQSSQVVYKSDAVVDVTSDIILELNNLMKSV